MVEKAGCLETYWAAQRRQPRNSGVSEIWRGVSEREVMRRRCESGFH